MSSYFGWNVEALFHLKILSKYPVVFSKYTGISLRQTDCEDCKEKVSVDITLGRSNSIKIVTDNNSNFTVFCLEGKTNISFFGLIETGWKFRDSYYRHMVIISY